MTTTTTTTHTNEEIIAAAKKAMATKDEGYLYVYERIKDSDCVYRDEQGNPSCLIGYILAELEPGFFEDIPAYGFDLEWGQRYTNDDPFDDLAVAKDGTFTPEQVKAMRAAQCSQDFGTPWGTAIYNMEKALAP